MESWWELGEHFGHRGNTLATYKISCGFCPEHGNFALHHHTERKNARGKILNYDILRCENCGNFSMVFWSAGSNLHDKRVVPSPLTIEKYPEAWPTDVGRFWLQAKRGQAGKNWDAAAVMARSALQLALRHKGSEGRRLFHEIDNLAEKGELPKMMKEWAHEVRVLATDPAHPTPGQEATSAKDVADAVRFLDFLLVDRI
jgi:hypothetical protein